MEDYAEEEKVHDPPQVFAEDDGGMHDPMDGMDSEASKLRNDLEDEAEGEEYVVSDGVNALSLQWVIGYNKDILDGIHNLTNNERTEIFYSSAHTGVIYDYREKTQKLLQGHCNKITCTACSIDKSLIVTADSGVDSMIVVWDSMYGNAKRTYFSPYENGVCAVDLSTDARYLATISNDQEQQISIWDLHNEDLNEPFVSTKFKYAGGDRQTIVKFNPTNVYELVAHGKRKLGFFSWKEDDEELSFYVPILDSTAFSNKEKSNADLTSTVFIPDSSQAVSSTALGDLLVWNISCIVDGIAQQNEKRLTKVLELQQNIAINTLAIHYEYLVTGNADGSIRFYDFNLKICAWFENLELQEIKSISFADHEPILACEPDETMSISKILKCSDFIVADNNALVCLLESRIFEELEPENKKGEVIFSGLKDTINCIAVHPSEPILVIGGKSGFIIRWNYESKENIINDYTYFEKEEPKTMEFSPDGKYLIEGTSTGLIRILNPHTMEQVQTECKISERKPCAITSLTVASDSQHFATMDVENCVCLFKRDHKYGDIKEPIEWVFYGKIKSHEIEITSIAFGESLDEREEIQLRLFSIGKDRNLIEYNVRESSEKKGLIVEHGKRMMIEQEHIPTSCIWYPTLDSKEDLLLTVNDGYKMKIWNVTSGQCRKTCLGPTYGGELNKLKKLEIDGNPDKFLVYSTFEKVVGLIKLPLDGNPTKTMGLIAHPDEVTDICVSSDGKYLFTCGGSDLCVNMWSIDISPIDNAIMMGGEGIEPFINLIQGGRDGQTFKDMKDFFYYAMIKSKTEDTTKTRKLDGKVPIDQLGNLMRAMGHYPTNKEIENMKNEVEFGNYTENCEKADRFDLNTFVRLFVNHRPVYGIGKAHIEKAFETLFDKKNKNKVDREDFLKAIASDGEPLSNIELGPLLDKLIGKGNIREALGEILSPEFFAKEILSFEEVEEDDEEIEEDMYAEEFQQMSPNGTMRPDIIPEETMR